MIAIEAPGVMAMNASEHFDLYIADKLGLRPVFRMKRDWYKGHKKYINNPDGSVTIKHVEPEVELEYPSKEEVDNYIRKREEYVADAVLKHCGWDEFIKRCKLCCIEDYIEQRVPCEAEEGQCAIDCPRFIECQMGKVIIPWAGKEVYDGERRYL